MVVKRGENLFEQHVTRSEQGDEHANATEQYFARENSGEHKDLRFRQPDDGGIHSGVFERDGGNKEDNADDGKNDKGGATTTGGRELAKREFGGAKHKQGVEGELRANRLVFEENEKQRGVEDGSER